MVRVLDENDRAVGPWDPKLTPDTLRRMLRNMALVRAFDERMFRAQRQGKTSFYMKSWARRRCRSAPPPRWPTTTCASRSYRQQGVLISRGCPLTDMMNQIYSNSGDKLQGKQLPIMYSERRFGFFSISGNLTTQYPQAVGWAMASRRRATRGSRRHGAARDRPRRAISTRR